MGQCAQWYGSDVPVPGGEEGRGEGRVGIEFDVAKVGAHDDGLMDFGWAPQTAGAQTVEAGW